jgi:hypothetical protein
VTAPLPNDSGFYGFSTEAYPLGVSLSNASAESNKLVMGKFALESVDVLRNPLQIGGIMGSAFHRGDLVVNRCVQARDQHVARICTPLILLEKQAFQISSYGVRANHHLRKRLEPALQTILGCIAGWHHRRATTTTQPLRIEGCCTALPSSVVLLSTGSAEGLTRIRWRAAVKAKSLVSALLTQSFLIGGLA